VTFEGCFRYSKWFHCLYLKNPAYTMYKVNYNSRTSHVSNYFWCHFRPEELLYDTEHDLLAIAKFLVLSQPGCVLLDGAMLCFRYMYFRLFFSVQIKFRCNHIKCKPWICILSWVLYSSLCFKHWWLYRCTGLWYMLVWALSVLIYICHLNLNTIFIARQHTNVRYWYRNSVHLSVRPWRSGVRWKWLNMSS